MFKKHSVFIFALIIQQMFLINSKTLPSKIDDDDQRKNSSASYYRHNIFGPNTYAFGYEVNDKVSGNIQFRDERHYSNGSTEGSYGYVRPDGSVMITHFLANSESGYLSQSQNFEPGQETTWQAIWPTRKANKSLEKPHDEEKVNLTSILLPVEPIKVDHGIDLNPPTLEKALVNPAVLEIINGEAPLISETKTKDNSVGFETVNKFIPPEFPIVPFELPSEDVKINVNAGLGKEPIPVLNRTSESDKSIVMNVLARSDSDSFPLEETVKPQGVNVHKSLRNSTNNKSILNESKLSNAPGVESIGANKNFDWYDKVINQTRQEYLETVH